MRHYGVFLLAMLNGWLAAWLRWQGWVCVSPEVRAQQSEALLLASVTPEPIPEPVAMAIAPVAMSELESAVLHMPTFRMVSAPQVEVGRILLEDAGGLVASARYHVRMGRREPMVRVMGRVWWQSRTEPDGTWVYVAQGAAGHGTQPEIDGVEPYV